MEIFETPTAQGTWQLIITDELKGETKEPITGTLEDICLANEFAKRELKKQGFDRIFDQGDGFLALKYEPKTRIKGTVSRA